MQKSFLAILATAGSVLIASTSGAISGPYPFGDEPYTLNWGDYPEVQSACWKWNWQQHGWDDYCAVYVHPKVFMYPRSSRVVLRSKG